MGSLQATPSANRLHIGVFGKTNSGKSTFINTFTGQPVSIVSDIPGTTTDPVTKAMEIYPLGPCVFIDTPGFDDTTPLGMARVEQTGKVAEKTEVAIFVISYTALASGQGIEQEKKWIADFKARNIPVLVLLNLNQEKREDGAASISEWKKYLETELNAAVLCENLTVTEGRELIREQLVRILPENLTEQLITGQLVSKGDVVLLIMPQDIQAPKGRLILPQVQTLRELLDKSCIVMCVTTDQLESALKVLSAPPKLMITDSQVFDFVYGHKPKESMLTSFSVLFAAYKGDISYYVEGAKAIDKLQADSKVLIAECCSHAPLSEDIGRVKIPKLLRKRFGETLTVDMVSGTDYPDDLSEYDLIIQCGACMFNRRYVLSRIDRARSQGVPMTNYGITIAHLTGILDKIVIDYK